MELKRRFDRLGMMGLAVLVACSSASTLEDDRAAGASNGGGGGSVGTGSTTGTGSDFTGEKPIISSSDAAVGSGGSSDASTSDEDSGAGEVCGIGTAEAKLSPVNMLVMFDRSGSMDRNNKWVDATAALNAFYQDPGAAGLRVAMRFFPDDNPVAGCQGSSGGACLTSACAVPLVDIGELTADPAPTDMQEAALVNAIAGTSPGGGGGGQSGGTPIYPALEGALQWATNYKAANPNETTVVIFVTDGAPNGCNEDPAAIALLAQNAYDSSGVSTYAIGLEGSNTALMDSIAASGGTGMGIYIGTGANATQELLDALNAIRGQTLSCDMAMPEPVDPSMPIDPATVNLTFTDGTGMAYTIAQVSDDAACGDNAAWHYDDNTDPTTITMCPKACDIVANDPNGKLEIILGCQTVCQLDDPTCNAPPEQVVPPVLK